MVKNSWHLADQEIDVWIVTIDNVADFSLSFSELAYLKTIKLPSVARRFESTRKLLRYLLSCYLGCSSEELNIEKTAQGKPFVSGCPELSFNITHAKEIIAIAVSRYPVGIDLELIRELDFFSIASRFFSSKELSFLKTGNQHQDQKTFFQLWTAKEAALKAGGGGIAHGLKNSFSTIKNGQVISVNVNQQYWQINPFEISEHAPAADFLGAIATPLPNPTFAIGNGDLSQYTQPQNDFSKHLCMRHTPHAFNNNFEYKSLQNIIHPNCESRANAVIRWHDLRPSVNNKA